MAKITFADKQFLNQNTDIPDINKCKDTDMNEIKQVVNANDDDFNTLNTNVGDLTQLETTEKNSIVGAINEVNSNCSINNQNINATEDIIEITPLVGSNYNNYGKTYYYKVGSIVYLHIGMEGLTQGASNIIYTLPSGYRPRGYVLGYGISDNLSSTAVAQIAADGTITIRPSNRYALIDMSFISFQ